MAVAATLLGACGDDPAVEDAGQPTTSVTTAPVTTSTTLVQTYTADLTTTDGYRYKVTVLLGERSRAGSPEECPGTAVPGRYFLPVTLTVANLATDRPAPFPPLRIEHATTPGTRPGQIMVKDPAGACTFFPRVPSIPAGATVTFRGTTPPIEEGAAPGSAGRIEVKVSESTFTLAAPVP